MPDKCTIENLLESLNEIYIHLVIYPKNILSEINFFVNIFLKVLLSHY